MGSRRRRPAFPGEGVAQRADGPLCPSRHRKKSLNSLVDSCGESFFPLVFSVGMMRGVSASPVGVAGARVQYLSIQSWAGLKRSSPRTLADITVSFHFGL